MDTDNEEHSIYNTFKKAYESATQEELAEIRKMMIEQMMKPFAQGPASMMRRGPMTPVFRSYMVVIRYHDAPNLTDPKTRTLFVDASDDKDAVVQALMQMEKELNRDVHIASTFVVPSFDLKRL
jgi:hypothetical protein